MSHELTIRENGEAEMFAVVKDKSETPWHKLGTYVTEAPTTGEAIKLAGLDWEVGVNPIHTKIDGQEINIEIAKTIYRKDNNKILGVTGNDWTPLQNVEAFKVFDSFIENGFATLDTAGSLKEGKKIWILAKLAIDPMVIVPQSDDKIVCNILMSNSHEGNTSVRFGYTPTRVVCQNTLSMALSNRNSQLIRVNHSSQVVQNLEMIKEAMNLAKRNFETSAEHYKLLASRQINEQDLKKYIKKVFTLSDKQAELEKIYLSDESDVSFEESEIKETRLIKNITELFETGRGNNLPGVEGTLWAAYNGVSEYLTHYRGRTLENRLNSLAFAQGATLNQKALKEALSLV